ncbi:lipocalin family protein [Pontibacter rugosus]|uniref:Lipocalin family protein n=1 Tax=Pontibacter rugosus TaxID=1745966 RepID=A0ABW3SIU7_9BACT
MKSIKPTNILYTLLLSFFLLSCGGGEEVGSENLISGPDNKTWVADEEINAAGDEQDLTKDEQAQTMQFYADGRFAMSGGSTLQTGTWSFDQAAKRLSLQFENQDVTQNFEVLKLSDDELNLRGSDGTVLELDVKK